MPPRLTNLFSALSPTFPAPLLVLGNFDSMIHVLHIVPEDGTIERFSLTTSSSNATFSRGGAIEQSREQIGTVTLHVGDGENAANFLDDTEVKARKLWGDVFSLSEDLEQPAAAAAAAATRLADNVLRPAALETIRDRDGRPGSTNAIQTYPIFVVHVKRSRPGRILTQADLTSFPR